MTTKTRPSINQQLIALKLSARQEGLSIKPDKRLTPTPYRAMNPCAAKVFKQPCLKNSLTYDPKLDKSKKKIVMDIRHELVEYRLMKKGKLYKQAHKIANKKQRNTGVY